MFFLLSDVFTQMIFKNIFYKITFMIKIVVLGENKI